MAQTWEKEVKKFGTAFVSVFPRLEIDSLYFIDVVAIWPEQKGFSFFTFPLCFFKILCKKLKRREKIIHINGHLIRLLSEKELFFVKIIFFFPSLVLSFLVLLENDIVNNQGSKLEVLQAVPML